METKYFEASKGIGIPLGYCRANSMSAAVKWAKDSFPNLIYSGGVDIEKLNDKKSNQLLHVHEINREAWEYRINYHSKLVGELKKKISQSQKFLIQLGVKKAARP